jgi:predicted P-loop ATPase
MRFRGHDQPSSGYLKDPTGARRFWPVACGIIDLDSLRRDRDQLWAEAVARFRAAAPWHLETPELEAMATAEQEARYQFDPWMEPVIAWLVGRNDVSVTEILLGAIGIPQESWSQTAQNRVADILMKIGFRRYRPGKSGHARTPRYRCEAADHQVDLRKIKFDKKSG